MKKIINKIVYLLLCLQVSMSWAQGNIGVGSVYERTKRTKPSVYNHRVAPITRGLPFFDNFIVTDSSGGPADSLWIHDGGVKISNGMTKNNIDYNVAVFDGTDSSHTPYSFENALKRGITDSLVSQYVDLSMLPEPSPGDTSTLHLSFFVQNGGYGEVADGAQGDQLSLSFKDLNGQWQQVWARKDSAPNVTNPLLLDMGFNDFFNNIYKPVHYLNRLSDSVNFVKRVYPLLTNFSIADQILKDSLNHFFTVWPGAVDFAKNPSKTDSLDLYKKVYRIGDTPEGNTKAEANYKTFFTNTYHLPLNFNTKEDSLNYFKTIYPYEPFPEDYYQLFFGKPRVDTRYKQLPVLYKDFSAVAVKFRQDSIKASVHKDSTALLARKLDTLAMDSLKHFRNITIQSLVDGAYNEFTRYNYIFNKTTDVAFFHDKFQMAFVSRGRQSGSFDIWGLDYVFLRMSGSKRNKIGRSGIARINDPAISGQLPSALAKYSSIPWLHFSENTPLNDSVRVLNRELSTGLGVSLNTVTIGYVEDGHLVDTLTYSKNRVELDGYINDSSFNVKKPTIIKSKAPQTIETIAFLNTTVSNEDPHISLKNDTLRRRTILDNYYAYDDGGSERSLEISGKYSELAYQYVVEPGVLDTITQLRLYFPKIISSNDGKSLSIKIWKRISKPSTGRIDDSVYYAGAKIIQYTDAKKEIEGFVEFDIDSVVVVRDTFYVGYELITADPIYVGYDLNPTLNSSRKIFYNVDGDWQRFRGEAGNLMMRPVFGRYKKNVTGREDWTKEDMQYQVYPNPVVDGEATVKGEMPIKLKLFDLMGNEHTAFSYQSDSGKIDVGGLKSGIYTLKIIGPQVVVYKKIIVN